MTQSRRTSALEVALSVTVSYAITVAAQSVIFPLFGLSVGFGGHLAGIAACFTAVSLVRSYTLRRVFNRFNARK